MNKSLNYYLNKTFKCNKIIQNEWNIGYRGNIKVIGDIHGDFNVLIKSLKKQKLLIINTDGLVVKLILFKLVTL